MSSKIQICNLALSRINARQIQSLSENIKEARECNLHYDLSRDTTLESMDWTFAKKKITLALSDETYLGWDYVYRYPSDCIRVREIYKGNVQKASTTLDLDANEIENVKIQYEIVVSETTNNRLIITNQPEAILRYTAQVIDANLYTPKFLSTVAFNLAAELAMSIKGDSDLSLRLTDLYMRALGSATTSDADADYYRPVASNSFVEAR